MKSDRKAFGVIHKLSTGHYFIIKLGLVMFYNLRLSDVFCAF